MESRLTASAKTSERETRRLPTRPFFANLLARDNHPHDEIHEDARHAAWNERQQEGETEPEGTDAEECGESAADTREHAVAF